MTRTLIGVDSQGVACVKITKGNIDPVTEPDGNASSFYFNSKWSADVKINTLEAVNIPAGTSQYLPSGSNVNTYLKAVVDVNATFDDAEFEVCIKNAWFNYMPYELPLFDIRWRRLSDNRYIEFNRVESSQGDGNGGQEPEYYRTFDGGRAAWWANKVNPVDSLERTYLGANPGNCLYYYPYDTQSRNPRDSRSYQTTAVIWRLPGDNSPMLDATPKAPVSGQFSIQITSDFCRVAKPGYDVRTATPTQLAFDSSGKPLSVIFANDVSIAPGVSSVNIGFPTTPNMLADLFPYTGSVITFPMARERRSLRLDYWFSGNSIFFNNKESFAMRVRFLVFANDPESSTVGDNDVLRQFEAGGENVVQFLRPGAGNPPALRDVMIDSRWPCLQILKEGYITTKTNPNRGGTGGYEDAYDVTFDATGVFPIVKYMTFHDTSALGRHVRPPLCAITRDYTDAFDYHQGRSTFCQLSAGKATFYTHNGNPDRERFRDGAWTYEFSPAQILGIRYYILGFPQT